MAGACGRRRASTIVWRGSLVLFFSVLNELVYGSCEG